MGDSPDRPQLVVWLFGELRVYRDGQAVPRAAWRTVKNRELLAILVSARGQYFSADQLCEWLWPGTAGPCSPRSLRKRISEIRHILEPSLDRRRPSRYVLTVHGGYEFTRERTCWVDVDEFTHLRATGDRLLAGGDVAGAREAYQAAAALHRGDYLPEFHYCDWAQALREALRDAHLKALCRLAECCARSGEERRAVECLKQALSIEPCDENRLLSLMRLHVALGEELLAMKAYESWAERIEEERGGRPRQDLRALYQEIKAAR